MAVAVGVLSNWWGFASLAVFLSVLFLQHSLTMAFNSRSSRKQVLSQVRTVLFDARSGFKNRPHDALIVSNEKVTPRLSVEEFRLGLQNQLILAPLTRGGNLPFRRLCADFNSNFTMSEMAYARTLFKGYHKAQKKERALAKKGPTERYFGFQIATKSSDEALRAAELAVIEGATWIDLNCGCPIYEATRRGLGAAMLKRPGSLEKLVTLTTASTPLPMTVKIRLGVSDSKINAHQVVEGLVNAGVAAVTVHGRTMEQRYTRPADWNIISDIARTAGVPIIGNGDILTWYEAEDRMLDSNNGDHTISSTGERSGVTALMAGRGALIKPWIFKEWADKKTWFPTPEERIGIYWQLSVYFKEHFGSDDFGKRHVFYFLPWHFEFFCRYRPLPDEPFRELSRSIPLIQNSREIDDKLISIGLLSGRDEPVESRNKLLDSHLERLLRCDSSECHLAIAELLWEAETAEQAVDMMLMMAHSRINEFEGNGVSTQSVRGKGVQRNNGQEGGDRGRTDESSWEMGGSGPRGTRAAPVEQTEGEEIDENGDNGDNEGGEGEGGEGGEGENIDEGNSGTNYGYRSSISSDRAAAAKLAGGSGAVERSVPWGRGGTGQSPSEIAIPFIELRVGSILSVLPHPDPTAENLVITTVDLGPDSGGVRTAVTARRMISGAGEDTGMDSIIGKNVILLCNVKPRTFFGVESSVMVLFSTDESTEFCPLYAPSEAPLGTIISFPGYPSKPSDSVNRAAKSWRQLEKDGAFYVNNDGIACFDPRPKTKRGKSEGGDLVEEKAVKNLLGRNLENVGGEGVSAVEIRNIQSKKEKSRSVPFSVYLPDTSLGAAEGRLRGLSCTSTVVGRVL